MRAIRSGRPRSGGVPARNFIDHGSRYLPALQRAPLVSMVKGTQERAIPFGRPFRRIAGGAVNRRSIDGASSRLASTSTSTNPTMAT